MQKISDLHRKAKGNRIRGNCLKLLRQMAANIMIDGSQLVIYVVIGTAVMRGEYSFASFVLMLNLIWTMAKQVRNVRQTTKDLFSQTVHVKKLRDTFDHAPRIRPADQCVPFVSGA
jgi:ABC-type multidrug transport system fused ATPase/permease subunit